MMKAQVTGEAENLGEPREGPDLEGYLFLRAVNANS